MSELARKKVYVVFDGPPGHESGRFMEVEDEDGRGVATNLLWDEVDGFLPGTKKWRLGPFFVGQPGFPTGLVDPDKPFEGRG